MNLDWLKVVVMGSGDPAHPSVAHTIFVLAAVIASGIALSRIKIKGISLGMTWILFTGIAFGHFLPSGTVDHDTLHFIKEFGLILFVFFIGLQVGPGFFSSLKSGGIKLIGLAALIIFLGVGTAYALHLITGEPLPTMVGVLSGAVTNTPGLGAAQQAYADSGMANAAIADSISLGYAVAYPLGVVGIIFTIIIMRYVLRVDFKKEDEGLAALSNETNLPHRYSVEFTNEMLEGKTIAVAHMLINRQFVVSRIMHASGEIVMADGNSKLTMGDRLRIICTDEDRDAILAFFGKPVEMTADEWGATAMQSTPLVSRRILITREDINGKKFSDLRLRTRYGINITRVHRAGVDLIPYQGMELQVGDKVMVVGPEAAVTQAEKVLGNSLKKLDHPNLLPVFIGIALGVLIGSLPLMNIPQPVKLGLAGGPLIVAILLGRYGPHFHLVTYTTMSANLMLREIGLAMFLAAVGIGAGDGFIDAIVGGGYKWIGYGVIITVLPLVLVTLLARLKFKLNYYTIMGLVSGAMTDPPALGFSSASSGNDMPAVSYATVYPVVMFLRVLTAQMLMLMAL
ncbi:MAG: putative transporter [Alistipes sp.]|nr:putative transporter [Alistipes sp.]MBR5584945.1 putative transporter [Alistipes sp.]MBR6545225.1 putative transporter [Alistipes sp.]